MANFSPSSSPASLSREDSASHDQIVCHRVKDCCVQLHSCTQKWKDLSSAGFSLANQIVNSTIQHKYTLYGTLESVAPGLSSRIESKAIETREDLFTQLTEVKEQLLKVLGRMGSLVVNLRNAVELSLIKGQPPEQPLFTTMPSSMFGAYSEEVYLAYNQEMSLRESIIGDLLLQGDRDTLTVYLSCWIHEPYLTSNMQDHFEAMLFECGLRS